MPARIQRLCMFLAARLMLSKPNRFTSPFDRPCSVLDQRNQSMDFLVMFESNQCDSGVVTALDIGKQVPVILIYLFATRCELTKLSWELFPLSSVTMRRFGNLIALLSLP